jgi:hypothetical protein
MTSAQAITGLELRLGPPKQSSVMAVIVAGQDQNARV